MRRHWRGSIGTGSSYLRASEDASSRGRNPRSRTAVRLHARIGRDNTAKMHTSLDAALKSGQIPRALVEDVRDQLALLAEVSLLAIMAGNLSARVENGGDLAAQA